MKISLSTRERVAIAAIMNRAPWGGSKKLMFAQANLYEVLGLAKFVGDDVEKISKASSVDGQIYEIPDGLEDEVLMAMLTVAGQSAEIALICVGVLRKIDPIGAVGASNGADPAPAPAKDQPS